MFRPIKGKLLASLASIYRDGTRRESERSLATNILADYAADQPQVLADLLMDADEKQFAVIFPKFKEQGKRGPTLLYAELDRRLEPEWKDPPTSPARQRPDPALVRTIEAAHGLLFERFAFCQNMPLADFLAVADGMRLSGYRPTRFRPYAVNKGVQVAAVWARDGRDWHLAHGLSAEEMRQRDVDQRKQSYQAVDVAGYSVWQAAKQPNQRFAALWVRAEKGLERRVSVGVAATALNASSEPLKKAGYIPLTLQAWVQGKSLPTYSSVWEQGKDGSSACWHYAESDYLGFRPYQLRQDVSVVLRTDVLQQLAPELLGWLSGASGNGLPGLPWVGMYWAVRRPSLANRQSWYAGVWNQRSEFESQALVGLDPVTHMLRCRQLQAQGYRPVAISVTEAGRGQTPVAASVWHRPIVLGEAREKLAKRQASAAVALLKMNRPEKVWPLFKHTPDSRVRSYLIHRLSPLGVDARLIEKRLDEEKDVTIRRALLLGMGEFGEKGWLPDERKAMLPKLQEVYRMANDPGLHAASEWLLRTWKQEAWLEQVNNEWAKDKEQREKRLEGIQKLVRKEKDNTSPKWYVNSQAQTMVVIPGPVKFMMGSPPTEIGRQDSETQHLKRIGRTFAIAATPVTMEQFLRFQPRFANNDMMRHYPAPTCPIGNVLWYEAAAYCNWLSDQEGIPQHQWCYLPNDEGKYADGMTMASDYLRRTGYRLPTEAEWEYACRASALTSRFYGESDELLGKYGWYAQNSMDRTWPVGSKKPNDLGLFELYGGVLNSCQESNQDYPAQTAGDVSDDDDNTLLITPGKWRVLRGGQFHALLSYVRSANRFGAMPWFRNIHAGFRPARTIGP